MPVDGVYIYVSSGNVVLDDTFCVNSLIELYICLKLGSCYSFFSFKCMFCRSLFVLLYFFF